MKPAKIADYGITEEFGYLPSYEPAQSLSTGNEEWDQFGKDLPKLLMSTNFRAKVKALPKFNIDKLKGEAEIQRAMLVLSYIGQSYQWSENTPATVMPANLAVPWYEVGKLVGRPPILSYQSYASDNWRRFDKNGPIECRVKLRCRPFAELAHVRHAFDMPHDVAELTARRTQHAKRPAGFHCNIDHVLDR